MPVTSVKTARPPRAPRVGQSRNLPGQTVLPGMTALEPCKTASQRVQREAQEQETLFYWLRLWEQRHPLLRFVYHCPNGLALTPKVARTAVLQGVKRGVWDIHIPYGRHATDCTEGIEGGFCPGLWVEMKIPPNGLTEDQEAFQAALEPEGYRFAVCTNWIDAGTVILEYLGIWDEQALQVLSINRKATVRYATADPLTPLVPTDPVFPRE